MPFDFIGQLPVLIWKTDKVKIKTSCIIPYFIIFFPLADRYISLSNSFDDLVDKFSKQIKLTRVLSGSRTNLRSPQQSGSSESIKFRKPISSDVIYIALKVHDRHGLSSNISNVVKVTFDDECECSVNPSICKNPIGKKKQATRNNNA